MQVGSLRQRYDSASHCRNTTWQQEGVRGFLKGCIATLLLAGGMVLVKASLSVSNVTVQAGYTFQQDFGIVGPQIDSGSLLH